MTKNVRVGRQDNNGGVIEGTPRAGVHFLLLIIRSPEPSTVPGMCQVLSKYLLIIGSATFVRLSVK